MLPAEGFRPTLLKLVEILDRLRIRFHLTGGIASVAYGEPRLTQDLDLVLDPEPVRASPSQLLAALSEAGFHFGEETARLAIETGQMFQLLDVDRVIKLDLYVRCLVPGELDRSVRTELFPGVEIPIVARPDAALSKLIWIQHGSHRSRRDLRHILAEASPEDLATVRRTAQSMDLATLLDEVLSESDDIDV